MQIYRSKLTEWSHPGRKPGVYYFFYNFVINSCDMNQKDKYTSEHILQFLREHQSTLQEMGVQRIGLFGSFAKGTQRPDSDIDIFVEMEPSFINLMSVLLFLEENLGRPVDLLRKGPHIRPKFLQSIEPEVIYA